MAEAGILCNNTDVVYLAGAGANSTYTAEAYTNIYIQMAEGLVCSNGKYDYVTNYASVNAVGKELLTLATATLAAIMAIQADMSGYSSGVEAESMITTLRTMHKDAMDLLTDKDREDILLS